MTGNISVHFKCRFWSTTVRFAGHHACRLSWRWCMTGCCSPRFVVLLYTWWSNIRKSTLSRNQQHDAQRKIWNLYCTDIYPPKVATFNRTTPFWTAKLWCIKNSCAWCRWAHCLFIKSKLNRSEDHPPPSFSSLLLAAAFSAFQLPRGVYIFCLHV